MRFLSECLLASKSVHSFIYPSTHPPIYLLIHLPSHSLTHSFGTYSVPGARNRGMNVVWSLISVGLFLVPSVALSLSYCLRTQLSLLPSHGAQSPTEEASQELEVLSQTPPVVRTGARGMGLRLVGGGRGRHPARPPSPSLCFGSFGEKIASLDKCVPVS